MPRAGETVVPMEEHTNWLSNTKWSVMKTYIQGTLYRLRRLCKEYTCIYMYLYAVIINFKRESMDLKESKEGYMGWSGERKGKGEVI